MWIDALTAGAIAGLAAELLVLRVNPEVTQTLRGVIIGMPLWASWGMLMVGIPLLAALALIQRVRRRPDLWSAPELSALIFLVAAILSAVNARLHARLVPGSAHRVIVQDAVAWIVAGLLALGFGVLVRRYADTRRYRVAFSIAMVMLPVLRMASMPTPTREYLEVDAIPLGVPQRPLLVVGLEGFDSKVLLADSASSSYPTLARLRDRGARVTIVPHRPYLKWALWTSTATGTYPGRHGVKAKRGWNLPLVFSDTLRLLPWTPEGSRMILPWGLSELVSPPPATVAPLWARLSASGASTAVFGWPGSWDEDAARSISPDFETGAPLEATMSSSLEAALDPFPERRAQIWAAILRDQARVDGARTALTRGTTNVWIHLETLSLARRFHEPLKSRHARERRLLELVMELVDEQLGALLDEAREDTLIAVVSPHGLAPPGSFERIKRLLGGGGDWHTSAESNPDGILVLLGQAIEPGRRVGEANPPDVAPTLCYLLDLPVAQYMEGGVLVDAVDPAYLAEHPLRVVD